MLRNFRGEADIFCPAELVGVEVELSIDSFSSKRILLIMLILSILSRFSDPAHNGQRWQDSPTSLTGCSGSTGLTRCFLVLDP